MPPSLPIAQHRTAKKSGGFTLIEMTLVVGLASVLLIAEMERRALEFKESRRDSLVAQMKLLHGAAGRFWLDQKAEGEGRWPASVAELAGTDGDNQHRYVHSGMTKSSFGTDFVFQSGSASGLLIQVELGSEAEAELLGSRLRAWGGTSEDAQLQLQLPLPEKKQTPEQTDTSGFYLLSGERALAGDMDVNRHRLRNVFELHAQDLVLDGTQLILSDPRAKTDIRPLRASGSALNSIRPIRYRKAGQSELGFSAAEVGAVFPELVRKRVLLPDATASQQHLFLSYSGMLPVLWAEVAHLQSKLRAVQSEVARLRRTGKAADPPILD